MTPTGSVPHWLDFIEKAQETRFGYDGMSPKYRYIGDSILESCFVSYVIVKSPSKPYIIVHSTQHYCMNESTSYCPHTLKYYGYI